jgi:hypothetical protein
MLPGAPEWALPPPATPMIWEGLSDRALCELLKDPHQNGHRTIERIVEHMSTPLVTWGWHPGDGRDPVPMPFPQFLAAVKTWAANGAACPAEPGASLRQPRNLLMRPCLTFSLLRPVHDERQWNQASHH